jgi:hypothetical protein
MMNSKYIQLILSRSIFNSLELLPKFIDNINSRLIDNKSYLVIIRLISLSEDESIEYHKMAGRQFAYIHKSDNIDNLNSFFIRIMSAISNSESIYVSDGAITTIKITFTETLNEVKPVNIKDLHLNSNLVKLDVKQRDFANLIPLTTNTQEIGIEVKPVLIEDKIDHFIGPSFAFTDKIYPDFSSKLALQLQVHKKNPLALTLHSDKFFYIEKSKLPNSLVRVRTSDDKLVQTKVVFDDQAIVVQEVKDTIISDNTFTRKLSNVEVTIKSNKIDGYIINHKLGFISKPLLDVKSSISDPRIGTLDIETYYSDKGYSEVYAAGFYTALDNKPNLYYIDKNNLSSNDVVLNCINDMLTSKYHNYTFYVHNLGRFDVAFILKVLTDYNTKVGEEYYKLSVICRDSTILKLDIKTSRGKSTYKIILLDSYAMLNSSLSSLGKSYNVDVIKGTFPHSFVNDNSLFYLGTTPDISHYNGISKTEYNNIKSNVWDLKSECLKYLEKDLVSLYQIMNLFNKHIFLNYNIQVTKCLTISRLALNIFLTKYYNNNIALINRKGLYNDIQKAYFGGITEVYKPYGENLYYYDVNSLYPYAALNSMPGRNCVYEDYSVSSTGPNISSLFGFYLCNVSCSHDNYLGLLPVRNNTGIIMPNGSWTGWYFSEELKFAQDNGYNIEVLQGYHFNKVKGIFDGYIKDLYKTKSETKDSVTRQTSKSLLNNLLGRFGMSIEKPITTLIDNKGLDFINKTRVIHDLKEISENKHLITFDKAVSPIICEEFGLNYIEVMNKTNIDYKSLPSIRDSNNVNISISAAITSYARIIMGKVKLELLKNNSKLYYSDTDSLVVDKPLDSSMIGSELGKYKLEHTIKRGYFISSKTYCLVLPDNSVVIKAKGVINENLNEMSFKTLLSQHNITAMKNQSKMDYELGTVNISSKEVRLNWDSYTKRTKVYKGNLWVDTKPQILPISEVDNFKDLVTTKTSSEKVKVDSSESTFSPNLVTKLLYLIVFLSCVISLFNVFYEILAITKNISIENTTAIAVVNETNTKLSDVNLSSDLVTTIRSEIRKLFKLYFENNIISLPKLNSEYSGHSILNDYSATFKNAFNHSKLHKVSSELNMHNYFSNSSVSWVDNVSITKPKISPHFIDTLSTNVKFNEGIFVNKQLNTSLTPYSAHSPLSIYNYPLSGNSSNFSTNVNAIRNYPENYPNFISTIQNKVSRLDSVIENSKNNYDNLLEVINQRRISRQILVEHNHELMRKVSLLTKDLSSINDSLFNYKNLNTQLENSTINHTNVIASLDNNIDKLISTNSELLKENILQKNENSKLYNELSKLTSEVVDLTNKNKTDMVRIENIKSLLETSEKEKTTILGWYDDVNSELSIVKSNLKTSEVINRKT